VADESWVIAGAVRSLAPEDLEPPPSFGTVVRVNYLTSLPHLDRLRRQARSALRDKPRWRGRISPVCDGGCAARNWLGQPEGSCGSKDERARAASFRRWGSRPVPLTEGLGHSEVTDWAHP